MKGDILASGGRKAVFAQGIGEDSDIFRNVYKGPAEETPVVTAADTKVKRMKFTPSGEVLLVRRTVIEVSSLIIDTTEKDKPAEGFVVAVGPLVQGYRIGANIVFGKYAGAELQLNGETLLLMEAKEVLGTLEPEPEEVQVPNFDTYPAEPEGGEDTSLEFNPEKIMQIGRA